MTSILRREIISTRQARIAMLARQMPEAAMHSLSRHLDQDWLHEAYRRTRKDGAVGVDGATSEAYAEQLEENLRRLEGLAKSGTYQAPPVRRVYIPKERGTTRPIGIPTFEDKVLQRAVVMLLEPIYERDFYDFSYGFRPGRSAHQAAAALSKALYEMGGGWVLDVDIRGFFDNLDHAKAQELLRQRVSDGVVVRLVGKWLNAGVLEGGVVSRQDRGTPQGGVISPLLANIYLHEVIDSWWEREVKPRMSGPAVLIRYADDFVMAFGRQRDAERVQQVLSKRVERFGLSLHAEKTKLVRFCRPRRDGGGPQPGTFDFLGFTFHWGRSRQGYWVLKRRTAKKRLARALRAVNEWLRGHRHDPLADQAERLGAMIRGHINYYGVIGNSIAIARFHWHLRRLWHKWLNRRSQRKSLDWAAFYRLLETYPLPPARLLARR